MKSLPKDWRTQLKCQHLMSREKGDVKIEKKVVTPHDAELGRLRGVISGMGRYTPEGIYTGLIIKGQLAMSDTPDEMQDLRPLFSMASLMPSSATVLIHGLGLGIVVRGLMLFFDVKEIDVVEINYDVIDLVSDPLYRLANEKGVKLNIIHADCFEKKWKPGRKWNLVWHDIWPNICADNLPQMHKLTRKFQNRCGWQGSWARRECERHRAGAYKYSY